ncbi:MAG: TetR/AcrR family transcriptional regulator [Verrucomicrobia bacterium]|nr:TetR/AcrR family transcriptional regulator [Verrucomicrobiota bacterium]
MQTAHELIHQQSYGAVGVEQICARSGVKKGSFYHFFRSKSDLTVAAYQYHWDQIRARWEAIFGSDQAPLQRIDAYLDFLLASQRERAEKYGRLLGCPFISLGSELSTQDEQIRRMAQEICDQRCAYLAATLGDAMAAGEIPTSDPRVLACEVHSYIMGVVQQAKIANDLRVLDGLKPGVHRILRVEQPVLA